VGQHKTWNERRDQLIQATIASIHEHGLEKTSVQRVANRAGLTAGVVAHYFGDKDGLLNATYEALYEQILENAEREVEAQGSPAVRVKSILSAYLSPDQLTPGTVSAWYELVSRLRQSPELTKIQTRVEQAIRGRLRTILANELAPAEAEILASGLYAMVTGFWVRMASESSDLSFEEHRKNITAVIDKFMLAFSVKGSN
jgi:transcriptional repressor BetI